MTLWGLESRAVLQARLSTGHGLPAGPWDTQRLYQSGPEVTREQAVDVESERVVGHFQYVGHGTEYLRVQGSFNSYNNTT